MKKTISIIAIFTILFLTIFTKNIHAASLTAINITTDKTTVNPGQNVKVNIEFGQVLGSYTFDVAYDSNLFEYVSAEGGTADDNGTRIRVYFFDTTGGSAPRSNMSVTFRAKDNITTSNPTDFSITAEGLANNDASIVYDDITTPIIKNVIVEPKYVDYTLSLNYTGDVIENKEKEMKLAVTSTMGRNYDHVRILAEATSPTGGTAKLLATDSKGLEHDIIQSGWGDASGYAIGGKDVNQELQVRGLFTVAGKYSINLKLVDRDNSDAVIATNTINVNVVEEAGVAPETPEQTIPGQTENKPGGEELEPGQTEEIKKEETTKKPNSLPKTGYTAYGIIIPLITALLVAFFGLRKKNK